MLLLPSFGFHTANTCPFGGLFTAIFFTFLCFLTVILLFKVTPRDNVKALFSVSKPKKARMCLWRMLLLDKLCSGMSYSSFGHEVSVKESTICIK